MSYKPASVSASTFKATGCQIPPCESTLTLLLEDRQQRVDALPQVDHHAYISAIADTKPSLKYCEKRQSPTSPLSVGGDKNQFYN